jgi:hypothetical protein
MPLPYPSPYGGYYIPVTLINDAGNLYGGGTNPPYTAEDFFKFYPQFQGKVNEYVLTQFIAMASACVKQQRWKEHWIMGMANYIAHFATLYLITTGDSSGDCQTASQVIGSATTRGLATSKSVGDVSVSYDFSQTLGDLKGWVAWKSTEYGKQFAYFSNLFNLGGMYIY